MVTPSFRRGRLALIGSFAAACLLLGAQLHPSAAQAPTPDDWLLNAPSDEARFRLLQTQARGFSASMIEVGQRYQSLYAALADGNFALASYQWDKIRDAIQTGYARRPGRQASADAGMTGPLFLPVREALRSNDANRAWAAFADVRATCMSCHIRERVPFMNEQPIFRQTAARPN